MCLETLVVKPEPHDEEDLVGTRTLLAMGNDPRLIVPGIAHDLSNILQAIDGMAHVIGLKSKGEEIKQYAEVIKQGVSRGREYLACLNANREHTPSPLRIGDELGQLNKIYGKSLSATNHELIMNCSDSFSVKCDKVLLERAVRNLVSNAAEAMPDGGVIVMGSRDVELLERKYELNPGRYVCLFVENFGKGIESDILKRMFQPFFTTKAGHETEKSRGLGLFVVGNVVSRYDGSIEVRTGETGTKFNLYFPAMD